MRLNQFHRCLQALQGNSPLAVSYGHKPARTDWMDAIVTAAGTAIIFILGALV